MRNNELFSKEALSAITSPEQLDQHIKIIRPNHWIAVIGISTLLLAAIFWCFFGNILDGQKARGIIFPQGGVAWISARCDGLVSDVLVSEGDYVSAGQTLMNLYNKQAIDTICAMQERGENTEAQVREYESMSIIKSEVSGIVQRISHRNETVVNGQKLATVINEDRYTNSKELIVYVPLAVAQKFKTGMEAQVSPSYAPREEYGYMKGYIVGVGTIPVMDEMLEKTLGNAAYAKTLLSEENMVEVRIALSVDPGTENAFLWSNPKGKTISVETNTICDVLIVFENRRPIDLLFR